MKLLKNSSVFLALYFSIGCQLIDSFNIKTIYTGGGHLHIINVQPNHIRQECTFLNAEGENNWRHQYSMYILNDRDEVIELIAPTHLDKDSCRSRAQKIQNIIQSNSKLRICARDELKKKNPKSSGPTATIQFGPSGNHRVAYETLTFDSICSFKKCFSNNEVWVNTCPGFVQY